MADEKLTQLPVLPSDPQAGDLLYVVRGGVSYQMDFDFIPPPTGVWGLITGTLSNQTDLAAALAAKAETGPITAGDLTMAENRLLGRGAGTGTGPVAEITVGAGLSLSAGGDLTATGGGTVTQVTSANGNATVANQTTTPAITIVSAPKLETARNINGVAFDGTVNVTIQVPVATGLTGLGTGVATALAVNVGSAGAPVVQNGALGTPSSGTLTNATGLPIGSGVSGLGSGVATFLATPSSANLRGALTDETGTGAAVFADSPALTTAVTLDGVEITPEIRQNTQNGNYTTVLADANKHLYHTSGSTHTWTIAANASVAYPIGTTLTFVNDSGGGNITIAITTDVLAWFPTGGTGSRTLAANGLATAMKVTSYRWVLTGIGLT